MESREKKVKKGGRTSRFLFDFYFHPVILVYLISFLVLYINIMSSGKPYIALVPGAWHSPVHYQELLEVFEKAGYPTASIQLPSVDSKTPDEESVKGDAAAIREKLLLPLLDNGHDVYLVAHSYGGCPTGPAAKGLSKKERNGSGGILGLVYMAAFVAREGVSLLSALGGKHDPWVIDYVSNPYTSLVR